MAGLALIDESHSVTTRRYFLSRVAFTSLASANAWAQKGVRLPTVGILSPNSPVGACGSDLARRTVCDFMAGLRALGYLQDRNVAFEYRFADGDYKRLPALAKELVTLRPDVIYTHTGLSADAAATATATIPIVVGPAGETSLIRLAGNLARPTSNVTGIALNTIGQDEKCLQLLKEMAPRIIRVAVLINPNNFDYRDYPEVLETAAARAGMTLIKIELGHVSDLHQALANVSAKAANAILLTADPLLTASDEIRPRVIEWAASRRVPLASPSHRVAPAGGLLSLSTDIEAPAHRAAYYVHRILTGARPADLPVERPTTFQLVVNQKTAAALGLAIPRSVRLRANQVIQ